MQLKTCITQRRVLYEVAIMLDYDALKTPCKNQNTLIEQSAIAQTTLIDNSHPHLETPL